MEGDFMYTYKAIFKNGIVKNIVADSKFWAYDNALNFAKLHNTELLYID